jgi:hypothetical protein
MQSHKATAANAMSLAALRIATFSIATQTDRKPARINGLAQFPVDGDLW